MEGKRGKRFKRFLPFTILLRNANPKTYLCPKGHPYSLSMSKGLALF